MLFTHNNNRGFTLLELLVVIAIIGILTAIFIISQQGARERARDSSIVSQMSEYQKALELYFSDVGAYPSTNSARTARFCIGDNPPGRCLGAGLTPNISYSNTSAINTALRNYMRDLPRESPKGSRNYSSPAYSGCTGDLMTNTSCTAGDYSFWFILEGTDEDCGRADVADPTFDEEYTLCRLQGRAID